MLYVLLKKICLRMLQKQTQGIRSCFCLSLYFGFFSSPTRAENDTLERNGIRVLLLSE